MDKKKNIFIPKEYTETIQAVDDIEPLSSMDIEVSCENKIDPIQQEFENIKVIKKNDICCIVGFAPSWAMAPYDKQKELGIDFWGINELYTYLQETKNTTPFAAWFEIHNIKESPSKQHPRHQAFLKSCKIPLVTQKHWDEYPSSIAYPRQYIKNKFNEMFCRDFDGVGFSDYSNQISWMIALAIALGYKRIMVYGVDMAANSEYAFQRASCQFFLGYAAGAGINLNIPSGCQLLKAVCDYGFESDNSNRFTAKDNINHTRTNQMKIRSRNGELDWMRSKLEKELEELEHITNAEVLQINKLVKEAEFAKRSAEEIRAFIASMPEELEKINLRKKGVLSKCKVNIKNAEMQIERLNKDKEAVKKKLEIKRRDVYVNKLFYEDELERNQQEGYMMEGYIGAYNHMLNNNLL